ncbi:formylglycine-generating enzyme family protein [Chitinophaga ginsengisoli]|uniref:Sulfatase-modifying factor enzyme 1 n=1 Tax=Chitinophaga ginsengisoli TaxID=363837 RepID=A0A2P8FAV1_9BACT|nr:SUMF1/EgtB/PvdO family nonheme iron enzyme [Chitinophaga ginsengisoli]PSL18818.1 sulfatase-modifying factor enzyme 1 [Chitinophaga ginsengisoli]
MKKELFIAIGDAVLKFCWCPPGKFIQATRGTSLFYKTGNENVVVEFTSGFWISATPLTNAQWLSVLNTDYYEKLKEKPNYPIVSLCLSEVIDFLKKINELNLLKHGLVFDLPNYLQSRYVCYARTSLDEKFYWQELGNDFGEYAWYAENSGLSIHEVGLKLPSVWGVYDALGNVSEMSLDVQAMSGQSILIDPVSTMLDAPYFFSAGGYYASDYDECIEFENEILEYENVNLQEWGMRLIIAEK